MKKLLIFVVALFAALFLSACGKDPVVQIETVKIPDRNYAFGKYEVTQKEYEAVMGNNPSRFKGENLPVECVSWDDAVAFCEKLTARERASGRISATQRYRLPTEEEWEHACRAGTTTSYYTGDSIEDLARAGWYYDNSGGKTHPVGQKEPNAFGLYDMHGNVWEWTSTSSGSYRVRRGGGWCNDDARECESSFRSVSSPDFRNINLGFRVVLEPGADVNARSKDGSTTLFSAVLQNDAEMVRWLIGKGADVRVMSDMDGSEVSLVQVAACGGREFLQVLEALLDAGADPNAGAESGFENSALKFALDKADGKDFSCAEALIRHGANVNTPSLLNFYVVQENVPVVKFLLKHGANPNAESEAKYGEHGGRPTALFSAAKRKNLELVKLLTKAGADVNKSAVIADRGNDDRLAVPVIYCCLDAPEIVKYLLDCGANPNAVVIRRETLLSYAVYYGQLETVKLLLDAGANPDVEVEPDGKPGKTVPAIMFVALDKGNRELFLLLKEKGAKLQFCVPVTVKIPDRNYAFGKYEVTQKEYEAVTGNNPSYFKGENLPVENVSWHDAEAFCEKLTARERAEGRISATQRYRLPTEEEWEHACRAGTTTRFYTGDSEADLARAGWYDDNSERRTHPVGQKEANAFGLYDMLGNVWEWTSTSSGSDRVIRGGGWYIGSNCESSSCHNYSPHLHDYDLGFRVVLDPAE